MSRATTSEVFHVIQKTVREFVDDDCPSMAAALAYYTIFSLPPLLVVIITVAGMTLGPEAVEGRIAAQIRGLIGPQAAVQVQTMIRNASEGVAGGSPAAWLGVAALVFAATTAFAQLQAALNRAWEVQPDPQAGGLKNFLAKRVLSFGMILAIAFLLLVSLALSTALAAIGDQWGGTQLSAPLLQAANFFISLLVISALFTAMFKVLPDADITWRDVWVGGTATGLLFVVGKSLIGLYLGTADVGSTYGSAGSLALILLWIYLTSMILLLGAEFTQVWARRYGTRIQPSKGAVRVIRQAQRVGDGSNPGGEVGGSAGTAPVSGPAAKNQP